MYINVSFISYMTYRSNDLFSRFAIWPDSSNIYAILIQIGYMFGITASSAGPIIVINH